MGRCGDAVLQPAFGVEQDVSGARSIGRRTGTEHYDDIDRLEDEVKLRRFTIHTPLFQWPLVTVLDCSRWNCCCEHAAKSAMMNFM
jgi:hypothetical protein